MDRLRDDHQDEQMPYGVDTIRLRISFPAAPVSRGYNGRAWKMRPLQGWTGGQGADAGPSVGAGQGGGYAGEAAALLISGHVPVASHGNGGTVLDVGGDVTNIAVAFDPHTQGVPVVLPDGSNVPDPHSPTGLLMSPYADAGNVAERGRRTGTTYFGMLNTPATSEGAIAYLVGQLALDLGHGGRFDYQRQGVPMVGDWIGGWAQSRQFRDVANFNIGLYMQQAGFTLEETLTIAGRFASMRSDNKKLDQSYGLDARTAELIEIGYKTGMRGVFGLAVKPPW